MKNKKIAVAMSVYKSDLANNLKISLDSIINQDYVNFHIIIQVDGPVGDDVHMLLSNYENCDNVSIHFNELNLGLAQRLNDCIEIALLDEDIHYIARMDSDDISEVDRFQKQVSFLELNPEVDVLGTDVWEISSSGEKKFYKSMDSNHKKLVNKIIKKCPFNHPSVMMKKSIFKSGIRYKSELMNTQDYYLWVDLIADGRVFANLNEPLLNFRVDDDFHQRRGFKKAMNDLNARIYAFKKLNNLNVSNLMHTVALFILRISPPVLKKIAYNRLR
ncbi:glycosyltransferase [Vibrio sp. Isolate34]|uniref:glycosyltransferase n=1 Tax=Vibrio sp. Isolate34 TaxID=2908540 RepID=UPI001EFE216F|nr:glycosyltransferase [Vibrio sp. Isolate34]MCG9639513.1 glycosyltransferase [Vibrio sp. Isolate34]